GALGGKCYVLGAVLIRQQREASGDTGEPPGPASALTEDCPPPHGPKAGGPNAPSATDPATQTVAPSGPGDCGARESWELSLGHTRPAAHAALSGLRAHGWIDHSTRAVSVHFTLYNPPTRLLSSVSLRAELLPTGDLALSPLVQSLAVFGSDSALWSSPPLPELAFLLLSLTHVCLQVWSLAEDGVRRYWRKPGNWLKLAILGANFTCHAASSHLATLTEDVMDHFRRGHFQGFTDLSLAASWNQRVTWLQGTLLFLLTLKLAFLVGIQSSTACCSLLLRRSRAGICTAGLRGSLATLAQKRKSFQSQSLVSLADLTAYVWGAVLARLEARKPPQEEADVATRRNHYLDEVSDLLDELLWKIHGLSDRPQRPLPRQRSGDTGGAGPGGHPLGGVSA
uniref:Uncharacterized protein n=1 Tax=Mustela putorius furo TaxID=9669 RepID=M3Z3A2_MUSPF